VSATARFTSYTSHPFDAADQQRLQSVVVALVRRGCDVVVSNSTADEIAALYERSPEAKAAGLRAVRRPARRAINSNPVARGAIMEFLISNMKPRTSSGDPVEY
jgi:site-specific DNA-adenine methylase